MIDAGMDFAHDLVERCIRRQRVADQRDIDAIGQWAFGKQRKGLLRTVLPIAAVNEKEGWAFVAPFEEVDTVAFAWAITQVEMRGISPAHVRRKPVPASDDVGASGYRNAVVETEVPLLLAHLAPVQRVERRCHREISNGVCVATVPENVLQH